MVYSGLPLSGFRTNKDQVSVQTQQMTILHTSVFDSFLSGRATLGDMEMVYNSDGLAESAETNQRNQDYCLLIGSLLFLWIVLWIQTQSLWVAVLTLIGAFGSYLWANLLYRIILNFYSFSDPQALASLVVAVVASYHTVYLMQAYTRALSIPGLSSEAQLSTALAGAHKHFLTVNSVLALSFFVSAASNFKTVMDFSVFCGLLSITSYISACIYLPTVIFTWSQYWSKVIIWKKSMFFRKFNHTTSQSGSVSGMPSSNPKLHVPMQGFFKKPYVDRFITHPVLRWLLISAAMVTVLIFLIAAAVQLRVNQNQVRA